MADVFKRTELQFGGAFAADTGLLVPNDGLTGLLMQNLQLSYSQNISRLYEIGISGQITHVYYVGGRSAGQMSVAHIVGPAVTLTEFYKNYSDVCKAGTNNIRLELRSNQCNVPNDITGITPLLNREVHYTAKFCVLMQIGISVAAEQFIINESSSLMFSNLEYEDLLV